MMVNNAIVNLLIEMTAIPTRDIGIEVLIVELATVREYRAEKMMIKKGSAADSPGAC